MNLREFFKQYPDDEACLHKIMSVKYGFKPFCVGCDRRRSFKKKQGRPVYQCGGGHQISPLVDTVFEKSTTKLQLWFFAIHLILVTRAGISAKQLQRELGVTYKTAWRMMKQIRILMGNTEDRLLDKIVEVDESRWGGLSNNRAFKADFGKVKKEIIMGMVQRDGKAIIKHIPNTHKTTLIKQIEKHIDPNAHIMTDGYSGYKDLPDYGYFKHYTLDHSAKEYVRNRLFHTNSVEGLWGRIKPAVKGVYRHVSSKYLESYMDEYVFRYNNRKTPEEMFDVLLSQI